MNQFDHGLRAFQARNYERAIASFSELLLQKPDDAEGCYLRGRSYGARALMTRLLLTSPQRCGSIRKMRLHLQEVSGGDVTMTVGLQYCHLFPS